MIDGPHIFGFSPVAFCINLISTLASARLVGSVRASINAATFCLVGLVLFSAISAAFHLFLRLPQRRAEGARGWLVVKASMTAHPSTTSPDSVFGAEVRLREKVTEGGGEIGFPTHRYCDTAISIPRLDASAARLSRECGVRVHTGLPVETAARTTQPIANPSIPFPIASEESVRGARSHRLG